MAYSEIATMLWIGLEKTLKGSGLETSWRPAMSIQTSVLQNEEAA